jgi:CO/xanthine dehydrogenase Mo-binding subunit
LRQAEVLRRVAEKAGLGTPLPDGTARGIATSFGQERGMPTWVAEVAVGLGEPATTVIAPAVANAIFAVMLARVTDIPITPQAVLAALTKAI